MAALMTSCENVRVSAASQEAMRRFASQPKGVPRKEEASREVQGDRMASPAQFQHKTEESKDEPIAK